MSANPFSIYVHFPYCSQRCPYCDFNVHVRKSIPERDFIASLLCEAKSKASESIWQNREISTIFLGGGTPSLFSALMIAELLTELKSYWTFTEDIEISMESNPDDITESSLAILKSSGVNRLSIGVQSLSNQFLKTLGRNHNASQAKEAVACAQKAGFTNINIDLMFSLPDQNIDDLKNDLRSAISLNTQHISYYGLTIELGTPFYERQLSGLMRLPSNDLAADFMEEIVITLEQHGYMQYETSNFAKAGFKCRHNQNYWQSNDYLGLGPGAHSAYSIFENNQRIKNKRWSNQSMPEKYLISPTNALAWSEDVSGPSLAFETLLLGLRQSAGCNLESVLFLLETPKQNLLIEAIERLKKDNFLQFNQEQKQIVLTKKGMMLADSVSEQFAAILR